MLRVTCGFQHFFTCSAYGGRPTRGGEHGRLVLTQHIRAAGTLLLLRLERSSRLLCVVGGGKCWDGAPLTDQGCLARFHRALCYGPQGVVEFSLCLLFAKLVSYTFLYWLPLYIFNVGEYPGKKR